MINKSNNAQLMISSFCWQDENKKPCPPPPRKIVSDHYLEPDLKRCCCCCSSCGAGAFLVSPMTQRRRKLTGAAPLTSIYARDLVRGSQPEKMNVHLPPPSRVILFTADDEPPSHAPKSPFSPFMLCSFLPIASE